MYRYSPEHFLIQSQPIPLPQILIHLAPTLDSAFTTFVIGLIRYDGAMITNIGQIDQTVPNLTVPNLIVFKFDHLQVDRLQV